MGAIGEGGALVFNPDVFQQAEVSDPEIERVIQEERRTLE